MLIDHYPGILKATTEMSRCNGGINRDRPVRVVHKRLETLLASGIDIAFDFTAINKWLSALSDDDLLTAVDGEQREMEALCAKGPPGVHQFLTEIWDKAI